MNRIKTILMAGAAVSCLFSVMPFAADAAGTARIQAGSKPSAPAAIPESRKLRKLADDLKNSPAAATPEAQKVIDDLNKKAEDQLGIEAAAPAAMVALPGASGAGGGTGGTASVSAIPNSDANYDQDRLKFKQWVHINLADDKKLPDLTTNYCLKGGHTIIGVDPDFATGAQDSTGAHYLPARLLDGETETVSAQKSPGKFCLDLDTTKTAVAITDANLFFVNQDDLPRAIRKGWDFGTLVVPFKFELTGDNKIQSSATVAGYLGYRFGWDLWGFEVHPVAFAGLSEIPTSDPSGTDKSQTVAGISYGAGIIGTVKDTFHLGFVVGFDHVDSAQPYAYQDKPWVALELGISFTK